MDDVIICILSEYACVWICHVVGFYLAVGFASGALQIVDACTLQSDGKECLQYSQDSITHLTFSQDSRYLAAAVSRSCIFVWVQFVLPISANTVLWTGHIEK